MNRSTDWALALTLSLVTASACKASNDEIQSVNPARASEPALAPSTAGTSGATPAGSLAGDDDALSRKLGMYIDCYNRLTSNVFRSWKRYNSWVDEKTGPTGKERNVYGLYKLDSVDLCVKELDAGNAAAPAIPELHAEAHAYKTTLVALEQRVNEAAAHYTAGDYKDDQWVKAKAMHAPLVAAFEAFKVANDAFDRRIAKLNDEIALRQLTNLERDPNSRLEALSRRAMHEAKALLSLVDIASIEELSADDYAARTDALTKAVAALREHTSSHGEDAAKARGLDTLQAKLQDYLTAAKELQRRKRDNEDFSKEKAPGGLANRVQGHPAQVVDRYNALVDASNRLSFAR